MNKRVLSLVLALVMILTMVPVTAVAGSADKFTDVEQGKWYYSWIENVVEKGFFAGTSADKFSPNVAMTRAMFVMVLANMEDAELDNSVSAFKDVEANKWYTGATKWASDNKIVAGYTDGTFKPDAIVTREQMATIMQNYINWHSEKYGKTHVTDGSTAKFADDANIAKYAKDAVANCREWGLVDGYTDGTFRPKNGSTRAEVAAVVSKLDWLVNGGGGGSWRPGNDGNQGGPEENPDDDDDRAEYTLTYSANCDLDEIIGEVPTQVKKKEGEKFVVAGPGTMTRPGYTFVNWNTENDYTGTTYVAGNEINVTENVVLYAKWEQGHSHVYGTEWEKDASGHWHECACGEVADFHAHISGGAATETTAETCTVCGWVIAPALGHSHVYGTEWEKDASGHWHECACGEVADFHAHISGGAATETTAETCTVCGWVIAPALGHSHVYGTEWEKDASGHWHECACGEVADFDNHDYTDETDKTCNTCGYERSVVLSYNLTYYGNGCDCEGTDCKVPEQDEKKEGEFFTVAGQNGMTREGYTFVGWNTEENGRGDWYYEDDLIEATQNYHLFAMWAQFKDFIYEGAKGAAAEAKEYYKSYVDTTVDGSSLMLNDFVVSKTEDENGARPQELILTGDLNENTVEDLGKAAVLITAGLLSGERPEKPTRTEVEEIVDAVIDRIESELKVNITREHTKQSIKDEAWKQVNQMKSVWSHFNNGEGAYYTGDITLSVGNAEVVVGIDEENTGFYYGGTKRTLAETAAHMGVEVARQLYNSLIEESNGKYIHAGKLNVVIGIDFSAPKMDHRVSVKDAGTNLHVGLGTYKQNAEQYPLSYPLTVTMDLKNTIGIVAYKYVKDDGSYIKLTITEEMQTKYLNGLEKAIQYALGTGVVKEKADEVVSGAMDSVKGSSAMTTLESALISVGYAPSRATDLIDTAMKHWLVKNANYSLDADGDLVVGNMYKSKIYNLIVDGDATFNNNDIMALADTIANGAANTANQKLNETSLDNSVKDMIRYIVTPKNLKDILEDAGADIEFDVEEDSAMEKYVLAAVADKMNGLALGAETTILQDIENLKQYEDYLDYIASGTLTAYRDFFQYIKDFDADDEERPYTTEAVKNNAREDINGKIQTEVEVAVEGHEYYDYLQLALKAKDIEAIQDAKLGSLADVFELDVVEGLYERKAEDKVAKADRFVDELVAIFKRVPESATVTIDGKAVDKDTLRTAVKTDMNSAEDVMKAGIELLRDPALKDLCIRDFAPEEGLTLHVSGGDYGYGLHLVIDVK